MPQDEQTSELVAGNPGAPDGAVREDTPAPTPAVVERARVSSIETTAMGNPGDLADELAEVNAALNDSDADEDTRVALLSRQAVLTAELGNPVHTGDPNAEPSGDLNQGDEASGAGETAVAGNPFGTDVAPGLAAPVSAAVEKPPPPPEISPVPITASGHIATAETAPDPTHWYNRPLIRKA